MSSIATVLNVALLIFVVVMIFNVIIFVHELGHFLAARWRGLQVDRFQIWFGKPIWSKTINGVQYGLGCIPAGGFVALPQMAPMEAIEGGGGESRDLPPISAMDKIIVAFAGPLFSMLLALAAAVVVWKVGKPHDFVPTQVIGTVIPDSSGERAGLQVDDKITHINGKKINGWAGSLDSVFENIVLSEGDQIEFVVERPGAPAPLTLVSKFEIRPKKHFWERSALRNVGIAPKGKHISISSVVEKGPAARAGLMAGDKLVSLDGQKMLNTYKAYDYIKKVGVKPITVEVEREGKAMSFTMTPVVPKKPTDDGPKLGLGFDDNEYVDQEIVYPNPFQQVGDSLMMMWTTVARLVSPDSNIGPDHLSGPVGIAKLQYSILQGSHAWQRLLFFLVLFNVNLAVLNMLPFPVLDGGHITLAILEKLAGRPVKARPLEIVQTACALVLISLMLYVTTKDIGDGFGGRGKMEFSD